MKKICLPILMMLILITLFGCKISDSPADDERRYACDAIPKVFIILKTSLMSFTLMETNSTKRRITLEM